MVGVTRDGTTGTPDAAEMVARARKLAPRLAERAEACERARFVPEATIADFIDAGLHRMLLPARFGGCQLGWETLVDSAVELGKGCGSQGWVLTVYGDHVQMIGMFDPEVQDEIWADHPATLCASAFAPLGKMVPANGGYRVSGKWSFSSGIDHAKWLLTGAMLHEGDGPPRYVYFLTPKSDAKVIDDWYVAGLAGTGSKSFTIDDAFVPPHRLLVDKDANLGTGPGSLAPGAAPIQRYPRRGAGTALAAVPVGVAYGMLDEFCALCADKARRGRRAASEPVVALRIAETAAELDCAHWVLRDGSARIMAALSAGETPTMEMRLTNRRNQAYGAVLACRAAERIFGAAGGTSAYLSSPLQRAFRDVHVAAQHTAVAWDMMASPYGLARLGHELDPSML